MPPVSKSRFWLLSTSSSLPQHFSPRAFMFWDRVGVDTMLLAEGVCFSLILVSTEGLPQTVPSSQQDSTALKRINVVEYRVGDEDWLGVSVLINHSPGKGQEETLTLNVGRTEMVSADMPWGSSSTYLSIWVSWIYAPPPHLLHLILWSGLSVTEHSVVITFTLHLNYS